MLLAPHIAIQVTRKGLDRTTSAAVLAPYVDQGVREQEEEEGGPPRPRWTLTVYEVPDNDQVRRR